MAVQFEQEFSIPWDDVFKNMIAFNNVNNIVVSNLEETRKTTLFVL